MGLFDFVKNVGRKLNLDDDKDQKQARPAQAGAKPTMNPAQLKDLQDRKRAAALAKLVQEMGFKVNDLGVRVDGETATLTGRAASQEDKEKIVLLVGNTEHIARVNDQLQVEKPSQQAVFYTVQKGDSLSKIAKQHYGDANRYNQIFEANRPLLKDPDEIYPGQVLRIPGLAGVGAGTTA
jgi:nucleoid-associated protein YgaU